MIKATPDEFKVLARYVYEMTGITLDTSKVYLIETRLGPLAEQLGCKSYSEFFYKAKSDATKAVEKEIINAITTNETLWFRDKSPFEALQYKILPDLIDRKRQMVGAASRIPLRIWSAACSTGQEVYSIAMTIRDMIQDTNKFDITILGTDISDAAVAAASYGKYNKFEMDRGLPPDKLQRYFIQDGDNWRVKDEIRVMANFKKYNLFEDHRGLGRFDVVFCRNVAIYFSIDDRKTIFNKIADVLQMPGYLLIGASEYLAGISERFDSQRHCRAVFYQLKAGVAGPAATRTAATAPTAATAKRTPTPTIIPTRPLVAAKA